MATLSNPDDIVAEFLRARLTDPRSRYTSDSDTFTATSGQTVFTLTPTNGSELVRAITSVTVASVTQKKWQEFTIDLKAPNITQLIGVTENDEVIVSYFTAASGSEWIYPGMPIGTMAASEFPRISVQVVGITSERAGPVNAQMIDTVHFQIDTWTKKKYTTTISSEFFSAQKLADHLGTKVKEAFADNVDDLYPKLYDYVGLDFNQMPFEEDTQTFRYKQEITLNGIDVGH